ncbi:MAG: class A beta-lactamase-related serine hydrolase [Elusimicrobiota bacterium]|nr:MAG: class A beta-lactamase-related serine hydrolase [Elusimicrobiota bacterium]
MGSEVEFTELLPFDYKIRRAAAEAKKSGKASQISIYFRDLENGPIFGVGQDDQFSPASLMKVPMMMATLKEAEKDPALLGRRLLNEPPQLSRSDFGESVLKRGVEYSVDELLRAMIAHSDNDSVVTLRTVIGDEPLNEVFRDFGMLIPAVRSLDDSMSVREYAAFFRILYNASYLDKAMSQKALEYLAASQFKNALAAGVPPGVTVAHKFGERSFEGKKTKQLHDCGIIYHPTKHYVLCVMTRGEDFDALSGVIREISSIVYQEVDAVQTKR